jgi:hypothetical protein
LFALEGQTRSPEETHFVAQLFPKNAKVLAEARCDEARKNVSGGV